MLKDQYIHYVRPREATDPGRIPLLCKRRPPYMEGSCREPKSRAAKSDDPPY